MSAIKHEHELVIGNIIGSNIFNLLWVLGFTSSVVELPFDVISNTDLMVVIGSSAMVILALVSSRINTVTRTHGIVFVLLYAAYLAYVVMRG